MEPDPSRSTPFSDANRPELVMIHALLYSIYAERKAICAERLRWRDRRNLPVVLERPEELKQHLIALRHKSKQLYARKKALEAEQATIIRTLLKIRTANEPQGTAL